MTSLELRILIYLRSPQHRFIDKVYSTFFLPLNLDSFPHKLAREILYYNIVSARVFFSRTILYYYFINYIHYYLQVVRLLYIQKGNKSI